MIVSTKEIGRKAAALTVALVAMAATACGDGKASEAG